MTYTRKVFNIGKSFKLKRRDVPTTTRLEMKDLKKRYLVSGGYIRTILSNLRITGIVSIKEWIQHFKKEVSRNGKMEYMS